MLGPARLIPSTVVICVRGSSTYSGPSGSESSSLDPSPSCPPSSSPSLSRSRYLRVQSCCSLSRSRYGSLSTSLADFSVAGYDRPYWSLQLVKTKNCQAFLTFNSHNHMTVIEHDLNNVQDLSGMNDLLNCLMSLMLPFAVIPCITFTSNYKYV